MRKRVLSFLLFVMLCMNTICVPVQAAMYSGQADMEGTEGEAAEVVAPSVSENIAALGCDFTESTYSDDLETYHLGDIKEGYSFLDDVSKCYLMQVSEEKKIEFSFEAVLPQYDSPDDGKPVFRVHKVKKVKIGDDDWDDEEWYECTKCMINQTGVFSSDHTYKFSQNVVCSVGLYIIEVGQISSVRWYDEISYDYKLTTRDVTQYATAITMPSRLYVQESKKAQIKVENQQPAGSVSGITWKSDNTAVAKVDGSGMVTGVKSGACNVTATLKNKQQYTCKVYVEKPELSASNIVMLKGQTKILKVKQCYQKPNFTSSNSAVVAVDGNSGKLTARKTGSATITVKVGAVKLTAKVKVENPRMNKTSAQMIAGDTLQLKITGTTQKVAWKTSNAKVAAISKGVITAKQAGRATITGMVLGKKFTCNLVVKDTRFKTTSMKLIVGQNRAIEWKKKVSDVKWSSSNKNIASVNQNGVVTAKKTGTVTIYAKKGNTKYACTVVCENPKLSKKKISLDKKKSFTLNVTGTTMNVKWKSSDKSIAAVTTKGKVTAKKSGTATITATVGGKELNCQVTVKAEKPSFRVYMLGKTEYDAILTVLCFENTGKSTLRIYSEGSKWIDSAYSAFDRDTEILEDKSFLPVSYIDVKPGKKVYVCFAVKGNSTWYDSRTKIQYTFSYDGVKYKGTSSYYYGSYYSKQ